MVAEVCNICGVQVSCTCTTSDLRFKIGYGHLSDARLVNNSPLTSGISQPPSMALIPLVVPYKGIIIDSRVLGYNVLILNRFLLAPAWFTVTPGA